MGSKGMRRAQLWHWLKRKGSSWVHLQECYIACLSVVQLEFSRVPSR